MKGAVIIITFILLLIPITVAVPVYAAAPPEGTTTTRDPWYPKVENNANDWQIVDGDYRDGKNGATTQVTSKSSSVVIRKNILPTADENIFTVAL